MSEERADHRLASRMTKNEQLEERNEKLTN